jgi:AraC-like DNA-binding protein
MAGSDSNLAKCDVRDALADASPPDDFRAWSGYDRVRAGARPAAVSAGAALPGAACRAVRTGGALAASELIHLLASALLESGARHGITIGLPAARLSASPGVRWSGSDLVRFMRYIGTELDDAFFGLATSKCPVSSSEFGVELMMLSPTLGEALDRYFRFYRVITDGLRLKLHAEGPSAHVEIVPADPSLDPRRFLTQWYTLRLRGLAQWLIGEEIPFTQVQFSHSPQLALPVYARVFGQEVAFGRPVDRFTFPSRYLNRRIVRQMAELTVLSSGEYNPDPPRRLRHGWSDLLKSSLRASLYRMAPIPTMEELAQTFGVSSQTLRRGLKAEGVSYRQVKAEARREVVLSNISDTSLTLAEISVLAGFAETNGLVRAMKSWTGLSPSAYRQVAIDRSGGDIPLRRISRPRARQAR